MRYCSIIFVLGCMVSGSVFASVPCERLSEKLEACEPYACQAKHGKSEFLYRHRVMGKTPNGKCHYLQVVPVKEVINEVTVECLLTREVRIAFSHSLRQLTGQFNIDDDFTEAEKSINKALKDGACELKRPEMF